MAQGRQKTYELRARFTATDNTDATFKRMERKIAKLERRLEKFEQNDYTPSADLNTTEFFAKLAKAHAEGRQFGRNEYRALLDATDKATPKAQKAHKALKRVDKTKATATLGIFGDKKVHQAIDNATRRLAQYEAKDWETEMKLDSRQTKVELRALEEQLRRASNKAWEATFGVTTAEGRAKLETLQGRLRAAAARTYQVRVDVDVDHDTLGNLITRLQTLSNKFQSGTPIMVAFAQRVYVVQQAMFALVHGALALLIASIGPFVAGLTTALFALTAFAGGLGLVALAGAPVVAMLAKTALNSEKVEQAQNKLKSSNDALASAQESRVSALRGLDDAQRNLEYSQQDLTDATEDYQDALREEKYRIQDLRYELEGLGIDEKELALDIAEARKEINEADNSEERQRAQLNLERLLLREKELANDTREAQKRLSDARVNGTEELQAARDQQLSAERQVAQAQEGVESALLQVASAQEDVARASREQKTAQQELAALMQGLPPHVEAVRQALLGFKDQFDLSFAGAEVVVAGLMERLINVGTSTLPALGLAAEQTGIRMGQAFTRIGNLSRTFGVFQSLQRILRNMPEVTGLWTEALGSFGGAFANIMAQSMPYVIRFSRHVKNLGDRFLRWTDSERGRARIKQFFESAAPVARVLARWVGRVASALFNWSTKNAEELAYWLQQMGKWAWRAARFVVRIARGLYNFGKEHPNVIKIALALVALNTALKAGRRIMGGLLGKFAAFLVVGKGLGRLLGGGGKKGGGGGLTNGLLGAAVAADVLGNKSKKAAKGVGGLGRNAQNAGKSVGSRGRGGGSGLLAKLLWLDLAMSGLRTSGRLAAKGFGRLKGGSRSAGLALAGRGGGSFTHAVSTALLYVGGVRGGGKGLIGRLGRLLGIFGRFGIRAAGPVGLAIAGIDLFARGAGESLISVDSLKKGIRQMARTAGHEVPKAGEEFLYLRAVANIAGRKIGRVFKNAAQTAWGWMKGLGKWMNSSGFWKPITEGAAAAARGIRNAFGSAAGWVAKKFGITNKNVQKEMKNIQQGSNQKGKQTSKDARRNFGNYERNITGSNKKARQNAARINENLRKDLGMSHEKIRKKGVDEFGKLNTKGNKQFGGLRSGAEDKTGKMKTNTSQAMYNMRVNNMKRIIELHDRGLTKWQEIQIDWSKVAWNASEDIQNSMNAVIVGMGKFIDATGIDTDKPKTFKVTDRGMGGANTPYGDLNMDKGGSNSMARGGILSMARGGKQGPVGGIASGAQRVVYGEVPGTTEFYITDNPLHKDRNLDILAQANMHMSSKYANLMRNEGKISGRGGYMATGDIVRMASGGVMGAQQMADEVKKKFGVTGQNQHYSYLPADVAARSVDFFVTTPGSVAQGAAKQKGDDIAAFVAPPSTEYAIWYGLANFGSGWSPQYNPVGIGNTNTLNHMDHVHATAHSGEFKGGQGGFSNSGIDYDKVWEKYVPTIKDIGPGLIHNMFEDAAKKLRSEAKDKYVGMVPMSKGSYNGGPAPEGEIKKWIEAGFKLGNAFPPTESNMGAMYSRVMQESGGNPRAINNWDSNAALGTPSKGLVQIIEPTWETHRAMFGKDVGSFDANWMDPIKSVATSTRYMKNNYGYVVGANGQGYGNGGLALKPHVGMFGEDGPEVMVPLHDDRAVNALSKAFERSRKTRETTSEIRNTARDKFESGGNSREIVDAVHAMAAELRDTLREELQEIALDKESIRELARQETATVLNTISSDIGGDLIEQILARRLEHLIGMK